MMFLLDQFYQQCGYVNLLLYTVPSQVTGVLHIDTDVFKCSFKAQIYMLQ